MKKIELKKTIRWMLVARRGTAQVDNETEN
jgi:hypothetical protein